MAGGAHSSPPDLLGPTSKDREGEGEMGRRRGREEGWDKSPAQPFQNLCSTA